MALFDGKLFGPKISARYPPFASFEGCADMQCTMNPPVASPLESSLEPLFEPPPIESLPGIKAANVEKLRAEGIETIVDLLFHLPLRYEDRTRISPIASSKPGDDVLICGHITKLTLALGRRPMTVVLRDESGQIELQWFNSKPWLTKRIQMGRRLWCYGSVRSGLGGRPAMSNPNFGIVETGQSPPLDPYLTPIYPTLAGLKDRPLQRLILGALDKVNAHSALSKAMELLPEDIVQDNRLPGLLPSLQAMHRPPPEADVEALISPDNLYRRRLAFEELLANHLALRMLRRRLDDRKAPKLTGAKRPRGRKSGTGIEAGAEEHGSGSKKAASPPSLAERFIASLPFSPTAAQSRVIKEIRKDLRLGRPMHRLLQGDVGAGKTVVAAYAAVLALDSGWQCALMAPTELLAEQHWHTLDAWLSPLGMEVLWLSGKTGGKERRSTMERLAKDKEPVLAIGTHALFQSQIEFSRLGLAIIDEQHRFGVDQRLALRDKGEREGMHPHQLLMTATPIPRTLAMTAWADLDMSTLNELPPGRTPVNTAVMPSTKRPNVVERIEIACRAGGQAYWVCTVIEESEALECQAAEDTARDLRQALPDLNIGLVHGRMKAADKDAAMRAFKEARYNVLVATTVIEVGVDVPEASLMIIDNADRLGLAQLHQLRGRVGRGSKHSVCVMMYDRPLTDTARQRLGVLRATNDGFEIAQKDLEIRGPGEVLGTRQTGIARMRIADHLRDRALLPAVARAGSELLTRHPLDRSAAIIRRWVKAEDAVYGRV
ncbi:ATP-dependent DNA helicase RecG [Thioalkalivibrio sp. HK1]|uniref:ATP-dependent DNA helicase RecG n=1 Tax=Thioalkalivibrio sp. HK1 TaxID=1469245 RepID=UPI00046F9EFF|nr:ATP-dependent DNA helicase RecG [Thioalkalivibrio sp. HK1]